jgi:hypothetical protein
MLNLSPSTRNGDLELPLASPPDPEGSRSLGEIVEAAGTLSRRLPLAAYAHSPYQSQSQCSIVAISCD